MNKYSTTIISIIKSIAFFALVCGIMYGCAIGMANSAQRDAEYAQTHNCRWDYNDMCYTRAERPWLFD